MTHLLLWWVQCPFSSPQCKCFGSHFRSLKRASRPQVIVLTLVATFFGGWLLTIHSSSLVCELKRAWVCCVLSCTLLEWAVCFWGITHLQRTSYTICAFHKYIASYRSQHKLHWNSQLQFVLNNLQPALIQVKLDLNADKTKFCYSPHQMPVSPDPADTDVCILSVRDYAVGTYMHASRSTLKPFPLMVLITVCFTKMSACLLLM